MPQPPHPVERPHSAAPTPRPGPAASAVTTLEKSQTSSPAARVGPVPGRAARQAQTAAPLATQALTRRALTAILLLLLVLTLPAGSQPLRRSVLGLYSAGDLNTPILNPLRSSVEMVLHHLGLHLEYQEYEQGLPDAAAMEEHLGVIVWLSHDRLPDAAGYWDWLDEQLDAGRRVVLLERPGPLRDADTDVPIPLSRINRSLSRMGLTRGSNFSDLPLDIEVVHKDPEMVEFERSLRREAVQFQEVQSFSPSNRVFLTLRLRSSGARADAVVLTPQGGMASVGYVIYQDPETHKRQWRLNPFDFLADALGVRNWPRPDATTLNGNRIFYTHIDGDGLTNMSYIDRTSACGEIIYERILKRYTMLPFTPSIVVAEIDPAIHGSPAAQELARRIFALPHVETASHTFSHPLIWNTELHPVLRFTDYVGAITESEQHTPSGQAILPWDIAAYDYDPVMETAGSCDYITRHLAPADKPCRVLLWSGDCLPDEAALAAAEAAGLYNMNGGDSRMDGDYPSYTGVAPLYRQVGPYLQIHSSNSNENTYTNRWRGPFGGFKNLLQTFERTESPRRVLAANVYYHMYSGEHHASVHALERVYAWVLERQQDLFPVYASRFVDVVRGHRNTRLERLADDRWRITGNGACRTIRFDASGLYPDWSRSSGLLGFRHYQGSLYVSLDESDEHIITLGERKPEIPYLVRASADVLSLQRRGDTALSFESSALDSALYVWAGLPPHTLYEVSVHRMSSQSTVEVRTDEQGILRLHLELGGAARIQLQPAPAASRKGS